MANLLKLTTISFLMLHSLLALHFQMAFSSSELEDNDEVYVIDSPNPNFRSRSKFLASIIKKGAQCNPIKNICNGISANKGTGILYCCKKHCRNVLSDKNNCGKCGNKCKFGMRCCNGTCMNTTSDANNCGKCGKKCKYGVKCEYGYCGYA
ncbi:hypothetical protein C1H46_009390 [Malus baccata]|uniref:Uncharacterized protein n=1 Tax=Malus baccata TaxID=106549 RepID=A0A540N1N0_MALBA|nr:hypothetical protein C1H46_009390 [Malus baccata]